MVPSGGNLGLGVECKILFTCTGFVYFGWIGHGCPALAGNPQLLDKFRSHSLCLRVDKSEEPRGINRVDLPSYAYLKVASNLTSGFSSRYHNLLYCPLPSLEVFQYLSAYLPTHPHVVPI